MKTILALTLVSLFCLSLVVSHSFIHAQGTQPILSCIPGVPATTQDTTNLNFLSTRVAGSVRTWGDSFSAVSASLDQPISVAYSKLTNEVFFTDYNHKKIRKVSPSKVVSTLVGSTPTAFYAVHVADNGEIYASSMTQIFKVNATNGALTVLAGSATTKGDSPDGTVATSALLNFPKSIFVTSSKVIYFTDSGNRKVKMIGTDGKLKTVAGNGKKGYSGDGGVATAASLNNPFSVVVTSSGVVYFTDSGNAVVRKVSGGVISTHVKQTTSSIKMGNPTGLALKASTGELFISDNAYSRIFKASSSGTTLSVFAGADYGYVNDGTSTSEIQLNSPFGLAFAPNNDLYFCDTFNNRVARVNAADNLVYNVAGNFEPSYFGNAVSAKSATFSYDMSLYEYNGEIYVADTANNLLRKVSKTGQVTTIAGNPNGALGDGYSALQTQLNGPTAVVVKKNGEILFVETSSHKVRKISTSGIVSTVAGTGLQGYSGDGGAATNAKLNFPRGLALNSVTGDVFIVDFGNYRIRRINATSGVISTVVGNGVNGFSGDSGLAISARISSVPSLFVSSSNELYFPDGHRVRKVSSSGVITTIAGNGNQGYSGDNGAATNATLNNPQSVIATSFGIFIADTDNNRVRKVEMGTGVIRTVGGNGRRDVLSEDEILARFSVLAPRSLALSASTSANSFHVSDLNGTVRTLKACSCPTEYAAFCLK
ncbi:hypothetical protein C9374_000321 [Naegleria lovaniensis]|uniref:Teneurin NHL domain-containing protein n=1 Tax=Naegleria lovaniensis TaxID=51637 RepID=A0AA88GU15_NAELO|nr:uncharacterized protein C9374_000321 [Naegleria lovaniensis]KAG2388882.1 hypothetical protein C9374_000321 [Naegleria lovaniensis]